MAEKKQKHLHHVMSGYLCSYLANKYQEIPSEYQEIVPGINCLVRSKQVGSASNVQFF